MFYLILIVTLAVALGFGLYVTLHVDKHLGE